MVTQNSCRSFFLKEDTTIHLMKLFTLYLRNFNEGKIGER